MGVLTFTRWWPLPWFLAQVPAARAEHLERPRVRAAVDRALEAAPMVIVAAPSGFGKTSALADWARGRDEVSWLSASSSADPWRLLNGGLLGLLPQPVRDQLAELPNDATGPGALELAEHFPDGATLVIDDAHLIEPSAIRHTLGLPSVLASGRLRVVLVGMPVLGQDFLRELTTGAAGPTIGPAELAMTPEETAAVVHAAGADLDVDDVLGSTGGWPVAVRLHVMAALADPGSGRPAAPTDLLADYVEGVVLRAVPEHLRRFVLRATTCSRLDGALADALLESDDGAQRLEECYGAGLFLDRFVDPDGTVLYRWHDAFAQQCRAMSARDAPDLTRHLHRIAADHLADSAPLAAAQHALRGEVPQVARTIIRRHWLRMIFESRTAALEKLCIALPDGLPQERDILLIRACCRDLVHDRTGAAMLHERALARPELADTPFTEGFAALMLASTPVQKAVATDRAAEVLAQCGPDDDYPHGLFLLGWSELTLRRNGDAAVRLLRSAHQEATLRGLPHLARAAALNVAFALSFAGQFAEAEAMLDQLAPSPESAVNDWDRSEGGLVGYVRGHDRFWRGDLHGALEWLSATIDTGAVSTPVVALARAFHAMTVAELGRADLFESAERHLAEIGADDHQGVPWGAFKRLATGRLLEAQGDVRGARLAVDPLLDRADVPVTLALLAELYRRTGEHARARAALDRLRGQRRPRYVDVLARTTLAAIDHAEGRPEAAGKRLGRSIAIAVESGTFFPFLAADEPFGQMLEEFGHSGTRHEESLATIFALRDRARGRSAHEALTRREREVLGFLRTSMTTGEVAASLHLSVATVKTHLQSIYRKLGVSSRREAVRVAR